MPHYDVRLHDLPVGQIAHDEIQDRASFRLSEEYRKMSRRPVLGQTFEDDPRKTYTGKQSELPPWFANLVPEGALRDLLKRSLHLEKDNDLPILVAVGQDLPGAVEVISAVADAGLFEEIGEEVAEVDEESTHPEDLALRFSLPGVQMKFSVLKESETVTLPMHGRLGDWIAKFDSRRFPNLVENEFATMEWARAAGFTVPECQILPSSVLQPALRSFAPEGTNVFLIRRYDRDGERRIHQEDFAQLVNLPPDMKYEQQTYAGLARLVREIVGADGYIEFIRRLAFMVASGNVDAHLKNWSLLYPDGVTAVLAPMYDQVATVAWPNEIKLRWSLKLAGTKDMYHIDPSAFVRLAGRAGGDVKETIRAVEETIERVARAWSNSITAEVMPADHAARLREYWSRAPLLKTHVGAITAS